VLKIFSKPSSKFPLTENNLSEKEHENFTYLKSIYSPLVFVCSFPRSGNTWLRFLMADCLLRQAGYETSTDLPIHPDKIIPDLHCHRLHQVAGIFGISTPRFYKSHISPLQMSHLLGVPSSRKSRFIYLYRNPEDALMSFYYFKLRYPGSSNAAEQGPDAFCIREFSQWVDHVSQALSYNADGNSVYLIRYEDLHGATEQVLVDLWNWLEIPMPREVCFRATNHMEFSKLQELESRSNTNTSGHQFFRKGQIGSAANELKKETIEQIRDESALVLRSANKYRRNTLDIDKR
jgi:estrone sulfotransferase